MNNFIKSAFRWNYSTDITKSKVAVAAKFQHKAQYPGSSFDLLCPTTAMLPFQFFIPAAIAVLSDLSITQWRVINVRTGVETNLDSQIAGKISMFQASGRGVWWTYAGAALSTPMTCDTYYSAIKLGQRWIVSEQFKVVQNAKLSECFKLEWYNSCDTANMLYNATNFKNTLYLESEPESLTPTVYEEGVENENKEFIPSKVVYTPQYQLTELLPEYLVEAFNLITAHKYVYLTYQPLQSDSRTFEVKVKDVQPAWDSQALALVTMKIEMTEVVIASGCCDNVVSSALIPLVVRPDTYKIKRGAASHTVTASVLANDTGYMLEADTLGYTTTAGGNAVVNPDGTFAYTPTSSGFTGTDTFTYSAQDDFGNAGSAVVTLILDDIHPVSDTYTAVLGDAETEFDASVGVLINDFIPWNYAISPAIYMPGGGTSQTIMSEEGDGNYIVLNNVDGSFIYYQAFAPTLQYNSFKYKIYTAPGVASGYAVIEIDLI